MPAVPITVGQTITSTAENNFLDWVAQTEYQSADLVVNNSVAFTDSATLVIPMLTGASYSFEANIMYDSPSSADIVIRFSYPTGTTGLISNAGSGTAITTATNALNQQATSLSGTSITQTYGGVATGTVISVTPSGGLSVTTAGNLVIGFSQSTATATNTLLKKWSWIRLSRIV